MGADRDRPWQAFIGFRGKTINLGLFATKEQAALAYDRRAVELFGEFARPNLEMKGIKL